MLLKERFVSVCRDLFAWCPGNQIEVPGEGTIEFFEQPMIGFAAAADKLFEKYKENEVIGSAFLNPEEWLPGAKTVAAFFFPFSEAVRNSNREIPDWPSRLWLYGRIEGQQFLNTYMKLLLDQLSEAGIRACVPGLDGRFKTKRELVSGKCGNDFHVNSS